MAFDLWTHQFCLACDKQTDGATYCSESCRLSDYEKTCSAPTSASSSPSLSPPSSPHHPARFLLSPAYDFSAAQPYGRTPLPQASPLAQRAGSLAGVAGAGAPRKSLTPSSSQSSLCSMGSSASSGSEGFQLSERSRKELQAYAVSFEQVRMHRRRSY